METEITLTALGEQRDFKAIGAIRLCAGRRPFVYACGASDFDDNVIDTYANNLAERAPDDIVECDGLVLLGVHSDGVAEVATWGVTGTDCVRLGEWGKHILHDLPVCPFQTALGWGNGGVPKRMSDAEIARLTPTQWAYVQAWTHPHAE